MKWNAVFVPNSQGLSFYNNIYLRSNGEILLSFHFNTGLTFRHRVSYI